MLPLLAFVMSAGAPPADARRANPQLTAEGVKACGFPQVRVKDDPMLQEDVVEVTGVSTATGLQLRCVAQQSIAGVTYVEFPAPVESEYDRIYTEIEKAVGRIDARKWLEQHGLLARLPTYEPGKTDDMEFGHKLEALCGPRATGAFIRDRGIVTLKLGTIAKPALDSAAFECLMNASAGSDFPLGFIGNEYVPGKK